MEEEQLRRQRGVIARLRKELEVERAQGDPFDASRLIWIFGSARTGSTWLGEMLGDLPGSAYWKEPLIGALFGEFYFERTIYRRGREFLMANIYRDAWLADIRLMALRHARMRFGEVSGYVSVNEPHGTVGAPLLSDALPESRLVLLVRDPRDVIASVSDRHQGNGPTRGRVNPAKLISTRSTIYLKDLTQGCEAFRRHRGPKMIVRYEDLRADTPGELHRLRDGLDLQADNETLLGISKAHSWESIPEDRKGSGRFHRKASPGSWQTDLTAEQIETVEDICGPVLDSFYGEEIKLLEARGMEYRPRARS